ncbi:hypothetical protein ANN_17100 [Periplaneta americana]|uniref:DUF659 domain-containing protein n=1 Tax=Periplaneta americana TaxID=6978 RepID=A0ABQ8SSS3_PERAM|nr:hypothetical protein ANN_17100 [Periplaneta americana]
MAEKSKALTTNEITELVNNINPNDSDFEIEDEEDNDEDIIVLRPPTPVIVEMSSDSEDESLTLAEIQRRVVIWRHKNVFQSPLTFDNVSSPELSEVKDPFEYFMKMYNSYMGGVDLLDRVLGKYAMRGRTIRVINHFFDFAIPAAWLEYRQTAMESGWAKNDILSYFLFRFEVAEKLIYFDGKNVAIHDELDEQEDEEEKEDEEESDGSSRRKRPRTPKALPPRAARLDQALHLPQMMNKEQTNRSKCRAPGYELLAIVMEDNNILDADIFINAPEITVLKKFYDIFIYTIQNTKKRCTIHDLYKKKKSKEENWEDKLKSSAQEENEWRQIWRTCRPLYVDCGVAVVVVCLHVKTANTQHTTCTDVSRLSFCICSSNYRINLSFLCFNIGYLSRRNCKRLCRKIDINIKLKSDKIASDHILVEIYNMTSCDGMSLLGEKCIVSELEYDKLYSAAHFLRFLIADQLKLGVENYLDFSCAAQQLNASQSTHRFSFVNHTIKTVNMPKVRHSVNLKSKLTSYISEFKEDGLSTDNKILFCNLCQCAVSSTQKFLVQQHITTSKHQANKQLNSKQRQLFLTQPTTSNVRSEFNIDLCRSLISADIPLYKLKNKVFREFLEKYTQHTIPDESTLRKTYAPSIYDETIQKIRDEIKDSSIWVSIDETPDKEGRLVGNVVIGLLSEQYSERILLHCDVLEKCNNKTIVKLFNEAMGILWPKGIMYDNVLFFISDAAPYMVKAGQALSVVYPKLTHFTCVAHAFHRVAEVVRDNFLK